MERYAIKQVKEDGSTLYWEMGRHWQGDTPDRLLTGPQADTELARLKASIPWAADRLSIIDVIVFKARAAIYGPAFRAAIAGKVRTPQSLEVARAAGNAALAMHGYRAA